MWLQPHLGIQFRGGFITKWRLRGTVAPTHYIIDDDTIKKV